jgi:ABC-type transporter Mla MlaB component
MTVGLISYTPIFAHLGHWYVSLPVFGAPVVIVAIAVKVSERRERRRARAGDTSRMRVIVEQEDGRSTLTVRGALDYPTLLDIEHELERVAPGAQVLLDLSRLTKVEEDFAWNLAEIIKREQGAAVTVLVGEASALQDLSKVFALEGLKLAAPEAGLR